MKVKYLYILILALCSCSHKSENRNAELTSSSNNDLVIIFNRLENNTKSINWTKSPKDGFYYRREGFEDPNLHILVSYDLNQYKSKISRNELEKMTVLFDSEMEYEDWFTMNFDKYYMIYQDEYLVQGSLKPDFKFTMYEIKVATGGTY